MHIDGYSFTKTMQATLWDAVAQAQALNHEYIGTEHLLLALLARRGGRAATVLRRLRVDARTAENRVLTILQRGRSVYGANSAALLPFTSRSKKVLELAKGEAQALQQPLVGTEHLLLGMLAERKGIAAQVLIDLGVDPEKARSEVLQISGTSSEDDAITEVPAGEPPEFVRVVLEYTNGAVVSKDFTTSREAVVFLEGQGRV